MELLDDLLGWLSDPTFSTVVGTLVAILGVPSAIWGIVKVFRESRRKPIDEQVAGIELQLAKLQSSLNKGRKSPRFALIIGNSKYQFTASLAAVDGDLNLVSEKLAAVGFRVIKRTNLTKAETLVELSRFRDTMAQGGVGLLYYAGHGAAIEGKSFIIPIDAKAHSAESFIETTVDVSTFFAPIESYIEDHPKDNGSIVFYSAGLGEVALDGGPNGTSPFARAFATALGDKHQKLSDFFRAVQRRTAELAPSSVSQQPDLVSLSDVEFSFNSETSHENLGMLRIFVFDAGRTDPSGMWRPREQR